MPEHDQRTQNVVNLRDQPVEIHHGGGALVIGPLGSAELPALPAADSAHLGELVRRGLLRVDPPEARGGRRASGGRARDGDRTSSSGTARRGRPSREPGT